MTSYSWSTGSVVFDPTLPITDVHADVQGLVVAVGHSFNLLGKLGLVTAAMPYALADVTGKILEQQAETTPLRAGRRALQAVGQPAGQSGDVATRVRGGATPHDRGRKPDRDGAGQPVLPRRS